MLQAAACSARSHCLATYWLARRRCVGRSDHAYAWRRFELFYWLSTSHASIRGLLCWLVVVCLRVNRPLLRRQPSCWCATGVSRWSLTQSRAALRIGCLLSRRRLKVLILDASLLFASLRLFGHHVLLLMHRHWLWLGFWLLELLLADVVELL